MKHTPRSKTNGLGASKNTKPEKIDHPRVNVDWQRVPPLMLEMKLRHKKRKSLPQSLTGRPSIKPRLTFISTSSRSP